MQLPFQNTKVAVTRSIQQIKDLLYDVNFTGFAEERDNEGNFILTASIGSGKQRTNFTFTVNISEIEERLNTGHRDNIKGKALRIGWRSFYYQIKALHDSIKLGTISIPEAFAGSMSLLDNKGNPVKVGVLFTELALEGQFNPKALSERLQITE